jgi:hypothetical protein
MALRPELATARIHFPDGRVKIVVLEEPPAHGRVLVGPLPRGRWICEGMRRSKDEPTRDVEYEVWPRLED